MHLWIGSFRGMAEQKSAVVDCEKKHTKLIVENFFLSD